MELVTVFKTFSTSEADLLQAQLETAGFNAIVADGNSIMAVAPPATAGGVRVQVPADQAEEARAFIEASVSSKSESSESAS